MKRLMICLTLAALLGLGGQAFAVIGTVDDVPGATLLLPKFVVEFDPATGGPAPDGLTTLFSVNNASAAPALVHVTLWTNKSVPTLDFSIFLTGYDVQTVNLRDVFNGIVPQTTHRATGTAGADGGLSPVGPFSLLVNTVSGVGAGAPASCNGFPLGPVPPVLVEFIRRAHRGQPSNLPQTAGLCYGNATENFEGYITFDNVNNCTLQTPDQCDTGYSDLLVNVNQLWGDYFYVDNVNNFAQGENLVSIEADEELGAENYTFYRRYCATGADQREGLGSTFAVRYVTGGAFTGGTTLKVWRDSKNRQVPRTCNTFSAAGFPLGQNQVVLFDEFENPHVVPPSPFSPPIEEVLVPFPWEVNNTVVGGAALPSPFNFGWAYLNLNFIQTVNPTVPFGPLAQNWVTAVMSADGRFSVGMDAFQLDNVTFPFGPELVVAPGASNLCLQSRTPGPVVVPCN